MEKRSIVQTATWLALALMLSSAVPPIAPTPEIRDAPQLIALGDPAAPPSPGAYQLTEVAYLDFTTDSCPSQAPLASAPATAHLGAALSVNKELYRVRSAARAPGQNGRVWLTADVTVSAPECDGTAQLWDFILTAANGTIYQPTPLGRRGEFTSYEIPAGGWATGQVFFNLPPSALPGGAVGIRRPPTLRTPNSTTTPIEPAGLWPLPPSLRTTSAPTTLPPA